MAQKNRRKGYFGDCVCVSQQASKIAIRRILKSVEEMCLFWEGAFSAAGGPHCVVQLQEQLAIKQQLFLRKN